MGRCAAPHCNSDSGKNKSLSFHSFPTDVEARQTWVKNMKRISRGVASSAGSHKLFEPSRNDRLCSDHFTPDQFQNPQSLMDRFIASGEVASDTRPRHRLKPGAIPTIFSHTKEASAGTSLTPRRESLYLKRKREEELAKVNLFWYYVLFPTTILLKNSILLKN